MRITATVVERLRTFDITPPPKHPTENEQTYTSRVVQYIADRMRVMGIRSWQAGLRTSAANKDQLALQAVRVGRTSTDNVLDPRRPRRKKRQKNPQR